MHEYQLTLKDERIVWGKDIESLIGKYPSDSIRSGLIPLQQ